MPESNNIVWKKVIQPLVEVKEKAHRPISNFPYMTYSSQDRLVKFGKRINPACSVDFFLGLDKLFNSQKFTESVTSLIKSDFRIAILGSSIFDRNEVKKIIEETKKNENAEYLKNLYFFDAGYLLI